LKKCDLRTITAIRMCLNIFAFSLNQCRPTLLDTTQTATLSLSHSFISSLPLFRTIWHQTLS